MTEASKGIRSNSPPFVIERTFNAPRHLVWDAWTSEAHLKQWFGPKGCKIVHTKLDLKPGGMFLYGMEMSGGHVMWGKWIFKEIVPPQKLVTVTSFSDENAGVTRHPLAATWPLETISTTTLAEDGRKTRLRLEWRAYNATDIEQQTFDAGHDSMTQGFGGTFDQLDAYLAKQT
jgi:uncharacterized protein YndB with AHSA1/START domain